MRDERKTKKQLIAELEEIRQQRTVEEACERIREEVLLMRSGDNVIIAFGPPGTFRFVTAFADFRQ